MRKRYRATFQRPPQPPWWSAPVFLLPMLLSLGLIVMVLALRLLGYPE